MNTLKRIALPLVAAYFGLFLVFWLYLTLVVKSADHNALINQWFSALYGIQAIIGAAIGLMVARKWGGFSSKVGRALVIFSLGLLAQEIGQLCYSYYNYVLHSDIPYPSVGDIGFFGSVLLYIWGAYLLSRALGVKLYKVDMAKKLFAVVIPLIILSVSYHYLLSGGHFLDDLQKDAPKTLLNYGYPFGQAIYLSIALLTFLLSIKSLGGIMKNKVLLLLVALVMQYAADFTFLLAAKNEVAFPGGANDLAYLVSYTLMALALYSFTVSNLKKPVTSSEPNNG